MTITKRTHSPYRFEHVGSFLRPARLKEAREKFAKGEITPEALRKVEDEEIIKIIEKQEKAGLKAITDGEFRRSWWHFDFFWGLNNVEKTQVDAGAKFSGVSIRPETARITGEITGTNHPVVEDFKFIHDHVSEGFEAKQPIPAPAQFLQECLRKYNIEHTKKYYDKIDDLIEAIAAAYRNVIKELYEAGCRTVQFDDCTWGRIVSESDNELDESEKEERKAFYVSVNNKAIEGKPEDLIITTHICRGNYKSTWFASGGYDNVATPLFDQENVAGYLLEYDSERAGTFEPLEKVTDGKQVVLGLVTSKTGELEDRDAIIARIKEATNYIPLDQISLSPQCGFSSTEEGNVLTEDQQWEKLAFIKGIVEEVWGE